MYQNKESLQHLQISCQIKIYIKYVLMIAIYENLFNEKCISTKHIVGKVRMNGKHHKK